MIETVQYSVLAYLVSGYLHISEIEVDNMMPDALLEQGRPAHAYIILVGTLVGMIPTVLDSLLVNTLLVNLGVELN